MQELIKKTFKENGAIDVENTLFDEEDYIYYINNMGTIGLIDKNLVSEESFIINGYKKLEFGYVPNDKDYVRFCFICSKVLGNKARIISRKEGFTIRALMEKAMTDFFEKYEVKNGPVGKLISKDINDVL